MVEPWSFRLAVDVRSVCRWWVLCKILATTFCTAGTWGVKDASPTSFQQCAVRSQQRQEIGVMNSGLGKAGGHGTMARGQVALIGRATDQLVAEITRRFLAVMGEAGEGVPLLAD